MVMGTPADASYKNKTYIVGKMEGGIKYDENKLRWDLLPFIAVEDVVKVLMLGAKKYGEYNWRGLNNQQHRIQAAIFRHMSEIMKGNIIDDESGLPHSAHVACNALFLTYFQHTKTKPIGKLKSCNCRENKENYVKVMPK